MQRALLGALRRARKSRRQRAAGAVRRRERDRSLPGVTATRPQRRHLTEKSSLLRAGAAAFASSALAGSATFTRRGASRTGRAAAARRLRIIVAAARNERERRTDDQHRHYATELQTQHLRTLRNRKGFGPNHCQNGADPTSRPFSEQGTSPWGVRRGPRRSLREPCLEVSRKSDGGRRVRALARARKEGLPLGARREAAGARMVVPVGRRASAQER